MHIYIGLEIFVKSLSILSTSFKNHFLDLAWWFKTVIPAFGEAEVGGSQGQKFKTSLTKMVKLHLF